MAKNNLNFPTVEQVKAKLHEMVDRVTRREYNGSVFYGLTWEDNTPPTAQVGDVVGQFDITFKRLRASDALAQAATTEKLAESIGKLSPEDRRKLLEAELAKL